MTIKERLDADIKSALLSGDKERATILRGLKSAILYVEVAEGARESGGIDDDKVTAILAKEAKKRQESADLYDQGGNAEKAAQERSEKFVIEQYLPTQLSETEIGQLIDAVISETGGPLDKSAMGQTIAAVKAKAGATADGGTIARLVKERLGQ